MSLAPKTIPFNIIDRSYLIPVTDDINGNYFPMSPITVIKLKESVSQANVIAALQHIATTYPKLRLGYRLDYENVRWARIPDAELADYLAACVHTLPDNHPIEDVIGNALAVNNEPLSQPINIFITGQYLLLRIHHSMGDGRFFNLLLQLIVSKLYGRTIETTPQSNVWWKPLWRIIWQNVAQGSQLMWQFVKSMFGYYQGYQQDTQPKPENTRSPIVSGSPMTVRFKTISADCLAMLNEAKGDISLNTLLQVMLGDYLKQLNFQHEPITYTIPVDLRRYLPDSGAYYPSNLASQIRVTLEEKSSLIERCRALQNQVEEQLQRKVPLVGVPGEWLLAMSGSKTYQSVNRDWLLKSTHNDPRVFVMSNLGRLDAVFAPVQDVLADDFSPHIAIPLMGSPELVFCFNIFRGQGNIVLTYDPQVFSAADVENILCVFDTPHIQTITNQLRSDNK